MRAKPAIDPDVEWAADRAGLLCPVDGVGPSDTCDSETDCTGRGSGRSHHTPTAAARAATAAMTVSSRAPRLPGSTRLSCRDSGTHRLASRPHGRRAGRRVCRHAPAGSDRRSAGPCRPSGSAGGGVHPTGSSSSSSSLIGSDRSGQGAGSESPARADPVTSARKPAKRGRESGRFRTTRTLRTMAAQPQLSQNGCGQYEDLWTEAERCPQSSDATPAPELLLLAGASQVNSRLRQILGNFGRVPLCPGCRRTSPRGGRHRRTEAGAMALDDAGARP